MKIKFSPALVLMFWALSSIILMAFAPMPALTAQVTMPSMLDVVLKLALGFASLVGVSQLVTVLVQVLKVIGVAKDDTASKWAAGLNILTFGVLVYFGVFQPQIAVIVLDGYAAQIATIVLFVLGFFMQLTSSKPAYDALKQSRIPVLSYSHSSA